MTKVTGKAPRGEGGGGRGREGESFFHLITGAGDDLVGGWYHLIPSRCGRRWSMRATSM